MQAKNAFSVSKDATIRQYSDFVNAVYGVPNDRDYAIWDLLTNMQKFSMRSIKGVRKNDKEKIKVNMIISLSWFISLMNRLHIDIDEAVWQRFPYSCSYCGKCPCVCKAEKVATRLKVTGKGSMRPKTIEEFQDMFGRIYPPGARTLDDAAIHLAEEVGELSEAFHIYIGSHRDSNFDNIYSEAADFFSCAMGMFNSINVGYAEELSKLYSNNCHVCKNAPCTCTFDSVNDFKS
jgi:NTP pyrophosphatase (non-canonical NTP hydrolase)